MLRSFAKAAEYIYIDQAKMAETKQWVVEKQQDDGCFQMVGSLFNQRMKVSRPFTQKRALMAPCWSPKGANGFFLSAGRRV